MNYFVVVMLCIGFLLKSGTSVREECQHSPCVFADENNQAKKEIPVLCYHNIRSLKKGNSPDYTIDAEKFHAHLQMLYDSGYTAILPDQLYEYLTIGKELPSKSVMITFDDSHEDHFTTAAPILERFGYRGVFFVMTVPIGKPSYLTSKQIKQLSDSGHVIAAHTWDHPNLRNLKEKEWDQQISQPMRQLEKITGKPVKYLAYPYGAWNDKAIMELRKHGIKAAFQLSEKKSEKEPLYTIRRLMVSGNWSPATLNKNIKAFFE